jgi:hypothetical protein
MSDKDDSEPTTRSTGRSVGGMIGGIAIGIFICIVWWLIGFNSVFLLSTSQIDNVAIPNLKRALVGNGDSHVSQGFVKWFVGQISDASKKRLYDVLPIGLIGAFTNWFFNLFIGTYNGIGDLLASFADNFIKSDLTEPIGGELKKLIVFVFSPLMFSWIPMILGGIMLSMYTMYETVINVDQGKSGESHWIVGLFLLLCTWIVSLPIIFAATGIPIIARGLVLALIYPYFTSGEGAIKRFGSSKKVQTVATLMMFTCMGIGGTYGFNNL